MKKLAAIALSAVLALSLSVPAFAGTWKHDGLGWWYQKDDGSWPANCWYQEGPDWYYFNAQATVSIICGSATIISARTARC